MIKNIHSNLLAQRISQQVNLTTREKKLVDFFDSHYTDLAFANIELISQRAKVGKSTVTRFVRKLGYANFADFLYSLRLDARAALGEPLSNIKNMMVMNTTCSDIGRNIAQVVNNLLVFMQTNQMEQLQKVSGILAAKQNHLYIIGGGIAKGLAYNAFHLLHQFRANVTLLDYDHLLLPQVLSGVEERSVLFVISFGEFDPITQKTMDFFHGLGCQIVCLSDRLINSVHNLSSVCIFIPSAGTELFTTSCTVGLSVIEALVASLALPGHDTQKRQSRLTKLQEAFAMD